ncbi:MAG: FtsX-like permease family protein [Treponema sp.]|nr:FtsX-like permease family protein [Treponema sp.]
MNKILNLALRNLTRQKRRNVILAIAIAFGFFVVTFQDGLITGMVGNLEDMVTQLTGGTVLIAGYEKLPPEEEEKKSTLVNIVRDREYIKNLVENNNINYRYFSCYTLATGQMIFNGKKSISTVYGRDLSEEALLESFQFISGGVENFSDPQAMIISDKTAESMNLQVGDQVIFRTTTIYGQNNVVDFTIAGIFKSNSIMSTLQSYVHIETLNKIVEIPEGGYSTFTIFLKNKNEQATVATKIENIIRADEINVSSRLDAMKTNPTNIGRGIDKQFTSEEQQWDGVKYAVETLYDEIPAIKTVLNVVHIVTTVILIVILLIVMVGVVNTYRMVLYERIREIGTMRALGMTGKDTGRVFTVEAVILCIIGALAGVILAAITMAIVHFIPINSETIAFFLDNGHFTFTISIGSIILQYLILIILTTIAVHGSAKQAARMSPAEALRTVK